jgi:hypothetical protein
METKPREEGRALRYPQSALTIPSARAVGARPLAFGVRGGLSDSALAQFTAAHNRLGGIGHLTLVRNGTAC